MLHGCKLLLLMMQQQQQQQQQQHAAWCIGTHTNQQKLETHSSHTGTTDVCIYTLLHSWPQPLRRLSGDVST